MPKGQPRSEETKRKISLKHKGKKLSEEHKRKLSHIRKAKYTLTKVFWSKIDRKGLFDCWEYTGNRDKDGYGIAYLHQRKWKASRLMWTLYYGEIPEGLCVCHKCNNPPCVNPAHLYLATNQQNTKDRNSANRQAFGERHGMALLSSDQVKEIIEYIKLGRSPREISELYPVSIEHIRRIRGNKCWKYIPR